MAGKSRLQGLEACTASSQEAERKVCMLLNSFLLPGSQLGNGTTHSAEDFPLNTIKKISQGYSQRLTSQVILDLVKVTINNIVTSVLDVSVRVCVR